jgi:hypothetical protein
MLHRMIARAMSEKELGMQTTIRRVRGEDGHLRFARPVSLLERILAAALPILWSLIPLVAVLVLWWAWK